MFTSLSSSSSLFGLLVVFIIGLLDGPIFGLLPDSSFGILVDSSVGLLDGWVLGLSDVSPVRLFEGSVIGYSFGNHFVYLKLYNWFISWC